MDRRVTLFGLAALAGAAASAQAQTAPAAPAAMSKAEMDHVRTTVSVGAASLQESDIALGKASGAKVKEFAKFEHDEQTTVAEIFKSLDPSVTPAPETKAAETITKLRSMQAGADFDRMFVAAQIEGHQMLLAAQDDYLKVGKDREHVAVTKLIRGMVLEHLTLLNDLKAAIG